MFKASFIVFTAFASSGQDDLFMFQALSRFTLLLDFTVVDPSQSLAFPMNVMALLPYMVQNYEDANELCIISAENIAQVIKNKKQQSLGLSP